MRIDITKVVANPFRDFELDPIEETQVERLAASIDQLGFFSGCTARKRVDGMYELACGHHRWKAAKKAEMTYIEAVVDNYTDNEMRRIMAIENLTQRGANTGAQLDAVAAFAYQVSYDVLTDRGVATDIATPQQKGLVLKDGPGERLIYQVINGFPRDEAKDRKAEDPKAEMISMASVKNAVATLKASGRMAQIVAKAYALVEAERAEDDAKAAEIERQNEAKRQAEEAKKQVEIDRRKQAEIEATRRAEEQRKASEAARIAAEKASAERKAEAERKAAEAKAAMEKAQQEREASATARRKAEEEAATRRKVEFERQAALLKEAEQRHKKELDERAKVQAQLAQEKTYDVRCNDLFPDPDFAAVFRKAVLTPGAREIIAKDEQFKVAKAITEEATKWKKFSNHSVGSDFISQFISEMVSDANAEAKRNEAKRKADLEKVQIRMRVEKLWDQVKRGAVLMDQSLLELSKEYKKWDQAIDGDFPFSHNLADAYGTVSRVEKLLRRMYGGNWGIPEAEAEEVDPRVKRIGNG